MKTIENIVISETEPSTNSLWIHGGKLLYFDGGWKEFNGENNGTPDTQENYATALYNKLGGVPYLWGSSEIFTTWEETVSTGSYDLSPYKLYPEEDPNFNSVYNLQIGDNTKRYIELFGNFILPIGMLYVASMTPVISEIVEVRFSWSSSEDKYIGVYRDSQGDLILKIDKEFTTLSGTYRSV